MEFDEAPSISMVSLALKRSRGLKPSIPRIEASLRGVVAEDLATYQRICGFPETPWLPLPLPQVIAGPMHMAILGHAEFPLSPMGIVHVSNGIRQLRPIAASEALDLRAWVEGHRSARTGVEFDLVTEARSGVEKVWSARTTVLSRAVKGDGKKRERAVQPRIEVARSAAWRVPEDMGRRYGRVAGDRNPIHLYPLTAKLFGFRRHIVHGMWSLARCFAELQDDLPGGPIELEVAFRRPVFLPSTVFFESGSVDDGIGFRLFDGEGKDHLVGSVS
ncbi:MAG TPA: MaoC/PaaZ C-terminal domain-containing protein [Myxococcota bacterium]|nr:MaoC/PaaZ C-terminal domain-containing protein [Myxococcota bacterium]